MGTLAYSTTWKSILFLFPKAKPFVNSDPELFIPAFTWPPFFPFLQTIKRLDTYSFVFHTNFFVPTHKGRSRMCLAPSYLLPEGTLATRWHRHILRAPAIVETRRQGLPGPVVPATDSKLQQCICSPTTHPGSFRCRYHHAEYVWGCRNSQAVKLS